MENYRIFVSASKSLSSYLFQEIQGFGFNDLTLDDFGVFLNGSLREAMFLNLNLRLANHIFLLLKQFKCRTPQELYEGVYEINWQDFIPKKSYVSVFSNVTNPTIRDNRFANLKCKDAIVDKLLRIYGARPDSGPLKDKIVIYIYWKNENCFIYLDTSGQPLSRRNWRKIPYLAPLNETLAAGIIFATGWDIKTNFINPMCGSGTLAIEAALMSLKRAPSCARENFSFMHFKNYAPGVWQEIKEQARKRENSSVNLRIIATDINAKAIEASRKNAKAAGVENYIDFEICDFAKTDVTPGTGVVVVNPGYGIRLGEIAHLERLYAKIGDFFKQKCQGYRGYIFSANTSLLKKVGLRPAKKIIFYNAEIECRLYEYPLYKGKANIQKP